MADKYDSRTLIESAYEIWRRRKWVLVISFLSVFGLAAGLVMALPDLYRSSTTLIVGQDGVTESLVENNVSTELELRLGIIRQALLSRGQLQEVIDEFNLYEDMRKTEPPASVIDRLRKDIDIEQQAYAQPQWGQSATFEVTISYQAWDPELAADVANHLAGRYQAENERGRSVQATRATDIIYEQLEGAREEFQFQEQRMTEFRNQHMGNLPEQKDVNLATLTRLNAELRSNDERQMQLTRRREELLDIVAVGNSGSVSDVVPGRLRLEKMKKDLEQLRGRYTDNHPEVIRLERDIQALTFEVVNSASNSGGARSEASRDQFSVEMDRDMAWLISEERRLQKDIDALTLKIEGIPRIEQQLSRLSYDYDAAREKYQELQKRFQDAVLAQSLETEKNQEVSVAEVAIAPDYPSAPHRTRLLFVGLVLAGGFAVCMLLLAEQLNKTFHSVRELRKFTRIPVLASIGTIQTERDRLMGWARFGMDTLIVGAGLVLLTAASYHVGQGGTGLVWAISG